MAKKPAIGNLFSKTEQAQPSRGEDKIDAKGVGLKLSEWQEIEDRAKALGMTRHGLAAILLRYGLEHLRSGKIKTKTETQKTTTLDI